MRKLLLLPLLIWGVIHAADATDTNATEANATKTTEALTMQNLELGMGSIQKGLMYNDKSIVQKGVDAIKSNAKDIDAFNIKNEEGKSFKAARYSKTEAKAISQLADDLIKGFDKGDKNRVLDSYRRMQQRCMICHEIVRKW